ncbi:Protein of unknown function [Pyronema omphalodes CBS 100304]|uniref:Uncharacterized protein n=1 Tax=Pyronema omphalodes (strain CBS 100304) TaxID=1076935 RepID=U4LBD3_PYROM|nr:Protein of unknown function [Pyronema omphalodes CBS 100304]
MKRIGPETTSFGKSTSDTYTAASDWLLIDVVHCICLERGTKEKALEWISPLEPYKTHKQIRSKRLKNTGT